jgi:N-methylhydantoinase A/oxoprolinase/acetone carboxylase beta subunit
MGAISSSCEGQDAVILDIGGTTTDISLLVNRVPVLEPLGIRVGPFKTLIRSLRTYSVGLGGDSLVQVQNGELQIGPERLGRAMAYGGPAPTPTDALIVMGKIEDGDKTKAGAGLQPIADALGLSLEKAAEAVFDRTARLILAEMEGMIERTNRKPVYTVHELLEGYQIKPCKIFVLGGPAFYFTQYLKTISDYDVEVVPEWDVANALGAALARTTCDLTLYADGEQGVMTAPEEDFSQHIGRSYTKNDAVVQALELLKEKALQRGADADELPLELIEAQEFNMVRGFRTAGKNIRVKVQLKPGLIREYDAACFSCNLQKMGV